MIYNPHIKDILSKEQYLRVREIISYNTFAQAKNPSELEYLVSKNLFQAFADALEKHFRGELLETDTPEGREYRLYAYTYSYPQLEQLLLQAYNAGRLAGGPQHMSFS